MYLQHRRDQLVVAAQVLVELERRMHALHAGVERLPDVQPRGMCDFGLQARAEEDCKAERFGRRLQLTAVTAPLVEHEVGLVGDGQAAAVDVVVLAALEDCFDRAGLAILRVLRAMRPPADDPVFLAPAVVEHPAERRVARRCGARWQIGQLRENHTRGACNRAIAGISLAATLQVNLPSVQRLRTARSGRATPPAGGFQRVIARSFRNALIFSRSARSSVPVASCSWSTVRM